MSCRAGAIGGRRPTVRAARDADVLRFRADSTINTIVREVAAEQKTAGVRLVNAEQSLAKSDLCIGGIPGEGLFYEHVHFNFDGNYLLARALLQEVEAALPALAGSRKQGPILSRQECAEALALTPWDEQQMAGLIAETSARPPFNKQLDHADRTALLRKRGKELGGLANTPTALDAAYQACQAAFDKTPDDCLSRLHLIKLALASGRPKTALEQVRIAAQQLPRDPEVNMLRGCAARNCGKLDEAVDAFRKVLEVDPGLVMANYDLALILDRRGQTDEAIVHYQRAVDADPSFLVCRCCLAAILERRGRSDESLAHYRAALEIDPDFALGHAGFGAVLERRGQFDEAVAHFQKALKINPRVRWRTTTSRWRWPIGGGSTRLSSTSGRRWKSTPTIAKRTPIWKKP